MEEEKDSIDQINFSNDLHLGGLKQLPVLELEDRITSSLKGIASTYQVLAQSISKRRDSPLKAVDPRKFFTASLPKYQSALGIVGDSTFEGTSPDHKLNSHRSHEAMPACFEDLIDKELQRDHYCESDSESTSNRHHIPKSNYFSNRMGSETGLFDTQGNEPRIESVVEVQFLETQEEEVEESITIVRKPHHLRDFDNLRSSHKKPASAKLTNMQKFATVLNKIMNDRKLDALRTMRSHCSQISSKPEIRRCLSSKGRREDLGFSVFAKHF